MAVRPPLATHIFANNVVRNTPEGIGEQKQRKPGKPGNRRIIDMQPKCHFCGQEMRWESDADFEDLGMEEEGVVGFYSCKCGCSAEFYTPCSADRDKINK